MQPNRFNSGFRSTSGGGCSRFLLIGGGCLAVIVVGLICVVVGGGFLWDRSTEEGGNWASEWLSEQIGTDISDRAEEADQITGSLPEPASFDSEDEYLEFLRAHNREAVAAVEEIGRLLSNPRPNNDQWKDDVAQQVSVIRQLEEQVRQATPPGHLQDAHNHWVTGMEEFRRASDSTVDALDNFSPGSLGDALDAMNNAAQSYARMAETLREQGVVDQIETIDGLTPVEQP